MNTGTLNQEYFRNIGFAERREAGLTENGPETKKEQKVQDHTHALRGINPGGICCFFSFSFRVSDTSCVRLV